MHQNGKFHFPFCLSKSAPLITQILYFSILPSQQSFSCSLQYITSLTSLECVFVCVSDHLYWENQVLLHSPAVTIVQSHPFDPEVDPSVFVFTPISGSQWTNLHQTGPKEACLCNLKPISYQFHKRIQGSIEKSGIFSHPMSGWRLECWDLFGPLLATLFWFVKICENASLTHDKICKQAQCDTKKHVVAIRWSTVRYTLHQPQPIIISRNKRYQIMRKISALHIFTFGTVQTGFLLYILDKLLANYIFFLDIAIRMWFLISRFFFLVSSRFSFSMELNIKNTTDMIFAWVCTTDIK